MRNVIYNVRTYLFPSITIIKVSYIYSVRMCASPVILVWLAIVSERIEIHRSNATVAVFLSSNIKHNDRARAVVFIMTYGINK